MSELPWFTLKTTAPTDPKWLSYARRANQPVERVFHVFCVLMAEARKSDDPGNVEHFDPEPIADYLRCEIEDIEAIYEALCQPLKRRGPVVEDGKIRNFDRHQPGRVDPTVNERMKRYRDKKKKEKQEDRESNGNATDEEVTQCYVTVTSRGEESREDSESSSRSPRSTMSRARKIDDEDFHQRDEISMPDDPPDPEQRFIRHMETRGGNPVTVRNRIAAWMVQAPSQFVHAKLMAAVDDDSIRVPMKWVDRCVNQYTVDVTQRAKPPPKPEPFDPVDAAIAINDERDRRRANEQYRGTGGGEENQGYDEFDQEFDRARLHRAVQHVH